MSSRVVKRLLSPFQRLLEPGAERGAFWTALTGALLGTLGAAVLYFLLLEERGVARALFFRELVPRPLERQLIDVVLIAKTALLGILPALLFAGLVAGRRRMGALITYTVALWLCFFFMIVDLRVYLLHGRHLLQILAYAALPEGREAGGSVGLWAIRFSLWAAQALGLALCGSCLSLFATRCCSRISSSVVRATLALPLVLCLLGAAPLAAGPGAGWRTAGVQARLLGVLPFSLGVEHLIEVHSVSDPVQAKLQHELETVYREKFSYLFRKREPTQHRDTQRAMKPNVLLILVESWRADALTPELMPELYAWAQQGLRRTQHLSGTNFSESGAFTILYGANPLVYHAVLDSAVPPPLCEGLRAQSYRCAYYTGHPTIWWRREEFLGPSTFDIAQRAQQGPWSEWDETSLAAFSSLAKGAPAGGYLDIAMLMSTHYEYRYPPEFERFVPAKEPEFSWDGTHAGTDFASIRNRYQNALGFVDHLMAKALRDVDISKDYVIVTGDHAEALGENGKVGHGYDFSDTLLHVPFVLRGPGIAPAQLDGITLHEDIWPTVMSLVTQTEPTVHDLRLPSQRRGALFSHCDFDQEAADAMLLRDGLRLRMKLGLRAPTLAIVGFEDAGGKPVPSPALSDEQLRALADAFANYLDDAGKPVLAAR